MKTLKELLKEGIEILERSGIEEAGLDAWLLLEYETGKNRAYFYAHPEETVTEETANAYLEKIRCRATHIPLQHITHQAFFMGYGFYVDENVLVIQDKEEAMNVKNQTEESVKKLQDETTAWVQQQREETDAYVKQQREENEAYVKQLKEDAERYAVQMFDHVLANMNSAINAIHNDVGGVMQAMNQAKEQIHSANKKV